ncbi:MAG: hypothetical protein K2J40_06190 [Ruminococcus sp.]|nr:hypothetical protein [Ruminococcus sp.]
MIDICNRHLNTDYTDEDYEIPLPQSALREVYALLVNRSYLPDDEEFEVLPCNIEWQERLSYEIMNLVNARKINNIIWQLKDIQYNNYASCEYIPDKNDRQAFEENPQAYEWEFRIFNSY